MKSHSRLTQRTDGRRLRSTILVSCLAIGVVSLVACSYGYAAFSSDLTISGVGTIIKSGANFTSTYMQDVTPAECDAVEYDATKQLIDKRDGRPYWVAKMRDGTCWMTQDLKFDIAADENGKIELTSELTDINPGDIDDGYYEYIEDANGKKIWLWNENSWLPPTETFYTNVNSGQNLNTTYSWNLGYWVPGNPLDTSSGVVWVVDEDEEGNEIEVYRPGVNFPEGVSHDDTTMTYNTHYLVGNYYQYDTASAGGRWNRNHPVSSICPKGWSLPITPDSGTIFDEMQSRYSDINSPYGWPLYLSRGGYYLDKTVQTRNITGYYWETWFTSRTAVYAFRGVAGKAWPTQFSNDMSFHGNTIRCVLRMPTIE